MTVFHRVVEPEKPSHFADKVFCIAFAIARNQICIKDALRISITNAAESQKTILDILKKVVINPHADGVVCALPLFRSSVAITGSDMGVIELKISLANERTMVNSK